MKTPDPSSRPLIPQGREEKEDRGTRVAKQADSHSVLPQPPSSHVSASVENKSASVMPHAPVIAYVAEEVRRQGHDIQGVDGIERVGWMLGAWCYAALRGAIDVRLIIELGQRVEPFKNFGGLRNCGVRVGPHIKPDFEKVAQMLDSLVARQSEMTPLAFYRAFEEIHPFVDGNGRTGKILLNLLNGTLDEPIFPPADFWGRPIQNP